ncbi:MAG: hypothetical protein COS25_02480 [Candidatus Nealsonbacteria bacterium CG02_land_8_20_14_3_00_37_10]|uniref:DUF11 domain-containing protein n=1 Tax=Candidatus Nealsonbacteria bacterium CG02_land_8_20_14_3_00_37_10 TaxID=1974699 RepID=A0A2M7D900_9BACT|nr:MAG: hypothetical protein COS25_02480 [Candidatus Nealsonbacteria bacterium CG02_land_8_20_14_3_00_37_10]
MKKITLILIILAVIVGVFGFYYYQRNVYSKDILKLEILGQGEADLFQEIKYIVKYKNNGKVRLEEPELIFDYPDYSIPIDGTPLRVIKKSEELGEAIYPGQEKTFTFTARLMGQEGEIKEARVTLSYRPKNLKARYTSETSFTTIIKKVPLNFDFDLPSKIESGKELKFRLNYFSNVDYPLSGLRVIIDYPSGFEFIDSTPKSLEKIEWELGLLNKAEGGRVEISGKLMGEVGEEKVFRARIGSWKDGEFILLKETVKGIAIIRPALYITQQINNNPKFVANSGDLLHYEIFFKNIGEEFLTDMFLLATLSGLPFDFETIQAPEGDFTLGDSSIIWDWRKVRDLQLLSPQSEGKIEFWVKLKDEWEIKSADDKNPEIKTTVFLSQVREEFVNKVNSKLVISQKGYFDDEIFGNSGPLPPKIGETTTYTIIWQVKNYYNEMKNVKVKATLPQNVNLTGKIFPEEQTDKITFDSQSREIVWNVGDLIVGQGILTPAPNIAFQISFVPGANQAGQVPELISEARITGQDQWTGEILQATSPSINTSLPDDEMVSEEGVVE